MLRTFRAKNTQVPEGLYKSKVCLLFLKIPQQRGYPTTFLTLLQISLRAICRDIKISYAWDSQCPSAVQMSYLMIWLTTTVIMDAGWYVSKRCVRFLHFMFDLI